MRPMLVVRLAVLVLGLCRCSPDSVVLLIHVKDVTPEVSVLQVGATLDGKAATQRAEFTQQLSEVTIKLPRDGLGQGQLGVNLFGLAADRCKLSSVRYDTELSQDLAYREVDLSLMALPSKLCTLEVNKVGDGFVSSVPPGIECGETCTVDLPPGTKVTLTAAAAAPFMMAFWEGAGSETKDSYEVTLTQARQVGITWGPELRPKLIRVPKGTFTMGSPMSEAGRTVDEQQHTVTLTQDFAMTETEVTQRQYRNLMGNNPSFFQGDDLPVEQVSWLDAVAYCNALSIRENLVPCYQIDGDTVGWKDGLKCNGYRLPTEAEWEYAARAPATTRYAGSDNVDEVAWYAANSGNTSHPVKAKKANDRGLYDLSGNVWEWVWDWYLATYQSLPSVDPIGPSNASSRVARGGSHGSTTSDIVRVAKRTADPPTSRYPTWGIRLARSLP